MGMVLFGSKLRQLEKDGGACKCGDPMMQYFPEDKECRTPECHGGMVWRGDAVKGCACPTDNVWNDEDSTCQWVDCAAINPSFVFNERRKWGENK